jgi:hypothetical protein
VNDPIGRNSQPISQNPSSTQAPAASRRATSGLGPGRTASLGQA